MQILLKYIIIRLDIAGAFSYMYLYTPVIFRNKLTTLLVFEPSSLARNGQLNDFVCVMCYERMSINIYSVYKTSRSCDDVCLN